VVYPDLDLSWIRSEFGRRMVEHPDTISIYMAYEDGIVVASGWTFFTPSTSFAGFYGGATHPAYRKHGLYTEMLAKRLQEVRQRGFRFVNVDAGSMSQPILMKLGFQDVAISNPCQWSPPASTPEKKAND
jgi:GNAT superfamily N-acetyltransferase